MKRLKNWKKKSDGDDNICKNDNEMKTFMSKKRSDNDSIEDITIFFPKETDKTDKTSKINMYLEMIPKFWNQEFQINVVIQVKK